MTSLCDFCGTNPAVSGGLCGRCESEQQRLGRLDYPAHAQHSDNPRPDSGKRHEQRVRDTRQHLAELPELYAQLALFILPGSTPQDPDGKRSKSNPAWRSVVNLDVLDLTDAREKSNSDPTRTDAALDAWAGARREGVPKTLHKWALRVDGELWDDDQAHDEVPDEPNLTSDSQFLLVHFDWITQQPWFIEIHDDVRKMRTDIRNVCGERDKHVDRFSCPQCGAESVPGGRRVPELHDVDAPRRERSGP
jgi:uncharacterized protein YciI